MTDFVVFQIKKSLNEYWEGVNFKDSEDTFEKLKQKAESVLKMKEEKLIKY